VTRCAGRPSVQVQGELKGCCSRNNKATDTTGLPPRILEVGEITHEVVTRNRCGHDCHSTSMISRPEMFQSHWKKNLDGFITDMGLINDDVRITTQTIASRFACKET
jgi:hypothetical protein